ncbi:hypothetical protein [Leptospira sp. 'Mane']|uniref:hypothetical protein n=1 Tax=Leptospira sp. 'Mane' TaxID=3387407 RepID=UPI00398B4DE0
MSRLSGFFILSILVNLSSVYGITVITTSGKTFENVTVEKDTDKELEIIDKNGIFIRIKKDKILKMVPDSQSPTPELVVDESVPTGPVTSPSNTNSLPEHSLLLSQSVSNDGAFQGSDLFGERQARRNHKHYKDVYESYFLTSSIELLGLPKQFKLGMTIMNPLVDRTNTDSDLRLQSTPGGADQTDIVNKSLASGSLLYDPTQVRTRKEKNGLPDYLFTRAMYDHETRLGVFSAGFLFINANDPIYVMRGYWVIGWKPPVLEWLNPQFSMNNKMLNDYGGVFQGTHNYRLSLSHEFFKGEKFRITPSLVVGYADVNDNVDRKKGVSDISPRLQFDYLKFFFAMNMMYRETPSLVDNASYTPSDGIYADTNQNDGKVIDPSKVFGYANQYILNQISTNSPNELVKRELIQHYQQQHIIHSIFFFNLGYTMKI